MLLQTYAPRLPRPEPTVYREKAARPEPRRPLTAEEQAEINRRFRLDYERQQAANLVARRNRVIAAGARVPSSPRTVQQWRELFANL